MGLRWQSVCLVLCVLGSFFWGCQPCEYVYNYPPSYYSQREGIKEESKRSLPPKTSPSKALPRKIVKKESPSSEPEEPVQKPLSTPPVKESTPEPLPIPSEKISRRTLKPKPYGLVVPFTEQCSKKDVEEEEEFQDSAIDWNKISPWIYYKDRAG